MRKGRGGLVSEGRLKCPKCDHTYNDQNWYDRHLKTHEGQPVPPESGGDTRAKVAAAPGEPLVYPKLDDWHAAKAAPTAAPVAPIAPPPFHFQIGPGWVMLGDFIDKHVLKESRFQIDMDHKKADELDKSLAQVGFIVQQPNQPVVIPWWVPLMFTLAVTFVLPIIATIVTKKLEEAKKAPPKTETKP
jgi:hypothetical protein